jgi:hypothetical protein
VRNRHEKSASGVERVSGIDDAEARQGGRGASFEPPADRGGCRARVWSPTRRRARDRRTRIASAPTRPLGSRDAQPRAYWPARCRESAWSMPARVPSETRALETWRRNAASRGIATRRSDDIDAPRCDEGSASACLLRDARVVSLCTVTRHPRFFHLRLCCALAGSTCRVSLGPRVTGHAGAPRRKKLFPSQVSQSGLRRAPADQRQTRAGGFEPSVARARPASDAARR